MLILFSQKVFAYTKRQQVMSDDNCLDAVSSGGSHVRLVRCHGLGGNQAWHYSLSEKTIKHIASGKCLSKPVSGDLTTPVLSRCDDSEGQRWIMESKFKWQAQNEDEDEGEENNPD